MFRVERVFPAELYEETFFMKNLTKYKKLVAVLLLVCLALTMTACGTTNRIDDDGNYIVDEDSTCAKLVGWILNGLHSLLSYVHLYNYVFAVILLTLLVKVATTPLNVKQQKSMKSMQAVTPMMNELNVKYKDDPQKKQEEVAKLYKKYNVSPTAGCLPVLIQMPILFILFYGMRNWLPPQDIIDAGLYSFFWIKDLSMTVGNTPYSWTLPILCALVTLLQQFFATANLQDTTQKVMLFMMPAMFLFITKQFPAALAVYWLFYGGFSAIQQTFLNYRLKTGFFTPKDERIHNKMALAEVKAKQEEKEQKANKGPSGNRHQTTHNRPQNNVGTGSGNSGSSNVTRKEDKRDKPWY